MRSVLATLWLIFWVGITLALVLAVTVLGTNTDIAFQGGTFATVLTVLVTRDGLRTTIVFAAGVVLTAAFIFALSVAFIYAFQAQTIELWRALWFINSFLGARAGLSFIRFRDLLHLPLPSATRGDLLVFRGLLARGVETFARVVWICRRIAGPRSGPLRTGRAMLAAILTGFLWLLFEGPWIQSMVQNRIRYTDMGGDK